MNAVRLNITLPKELADQLNDLVDSRGKSRFIAGAVKQKIREIHNDRLERILEEGYRATSKEALIMAKEFGPADLEGWDEY